VGIVFQFFQLLPTLTLLENTILPMDYCNVYPYNERPLRAMELLKMVGLEDHIHDLPANVSNGQQQAAAIARSIATDPSIIVADEPTGNLDSRSADVVIRVFQELADLGKTILLVTHDPSLTSRVDRTVIISDGLIIDPTVASTLPSLDHPQMLHATNEVEKRIYEPGEVIIRQGDPVEYFYMVGNGCVEIVGDGETAVSTLSTHEFFGEVELMGKGTAVATVRAGSQPTELALLPKDEFFKIMTDSPETSDQIMQVAKERRAENEARRQLEMA
jgi:energy-coupling factor transporter ATP-binding protein EcfA2